MFGKIGPGELILILVIALVIFGPKKLPEIGKAVGEAIRNLKKHTDKVTEEIEEATSIEPDAPPEPVVRDAADRKSKAGQPAAAAAGESEPLGLTNTPAAGAAALPTGIAPARRKATTTGKNGVDRTGKA